MHTPDTDPDTFDTRIKNMIKQTLSEASEDASKAVSGELLILAKSLLRAGEIETAKYVCDITGNSVIMQHEETAAEWGHMRKACAKLAESLSAVSGEHFNLLRGNDDEKAISEFFDRTRVIGCIDSLKLSEFYISECWHIYLSTDQLGKMLDSMARISSADKGLFYRAYKSFIDYHYTSENLIMRLFAHKTMIKSLETDIDIMSEAVLKNDSKEIEFELPAVLSSPCSNFM